MGQFSDLRVLELASVLAGPSVGQFFAELGAEVIKIENVGTHGDVTRSWKVAGEDTDDRSAYFCSVNWGKKSVALDLNTSAGKKAVHKIASRCDVVIASYKPGDAEKLGVDYKTLSEFNPSIIYGQVTGYGSHNARVGYDAIIQAESGFMSMNGEPNGPSLKIPVALMDVIAGHHLKEALLLAMLDKMATGRGKLVEVSLIQAAVSSLVNQATNWLVVGKLPRKQGSSHPNIAPYGDVFTTADRKEIILAVGSDLQFINLCELLQIESIATDERFRTNRERVQNRSALAEVLRLKITQHDSQQLLKKLHSKNVPAGIIQNMEDVFKMPEASALVFESNKLKGIRSMVSDGIEITNDLLPPPHLGEHNREVLEWLGLG